MLSLAKVYGLMLGVLATTLLAEPKVISPLYGNPIKEAQRSTYCTHLGVDFHGQEESEISMR